MADDDYSDVHDALGLTPLAPPGPLARQVAKGPGAVLGSVSNLLGITDAGRALRGEMSEDEAKFFALTAGLGLVPGARAEGKAAEAAVPLMEDLFPHSGSLGKYAKMTPSEYVASYGDAHQFSKTFPESFKVIAPHLSEDQKLEMATGQIHEALGIREDLPTKYQDQEPKLSEKTFGNMYAPPQNPTIAEGGKWIDQYKNLSSVKQQSAVDQKFQTLNTQYYAWLKKNNLPKISIDEHDPSTLSVSQKQTLGLFKDTYDQLLSNQLTGVAEDTKGASSIWNQKQQTFTKPPPGAWWQPANFKPYGAAESYSQDVPFGVPQRAQQLGFNQPAAHGTGGSTWKDWEGPLDMLKLPEDQLGVHFGNPRQAQRFSTGLNSLMTGGSSIAGTNTPRTYPVVLQMQHPLEMRDMGSWHLDDIRTALESINRGEHFYNHYTHAGAVSVQLSPEAKGMFPQHELDDLGNIQEARDYIASKGYDSIKYTNNVEDPGHPSYILFQDSPTQKGYVIGARSPYAQFDPSKLHLPGLGLGLGGVLAYPLTRGGEESQ